MEKLGAVMGPVLTGLSYPSAGSVESGQVNGAVASAEGRSAPPKRDPSEASLFHVSSQGDFPRRGTRSATAAAKAAVGGGEKADRALPAACPSPRSGASGSLLCPNKSSDDGQSPGREKGAGKRDVVSSGDRQTNGASRHPGRSAACRGPRQDLFHTPRVAKDAKTPAAAPVNATSSRKSWKGDNGNVSQKTARDAGLPACGGRGGVDEETQTKLVTSRGRAAIASEASTARRLAAARGAAAAAEAALKATQARTKWEGAVVIHSPFSAALLPPSTQSLPSRCRASRNSSTCQTASSATDPAPNVPGNWRGCGKEHAGIAGQHRRHRPGALTFPRSGGGKKESQRTSSERGGMDQVVVVLSSSDDDEPRGRKLGKSGNTRRQGAVLAVRAGDLSYLQRQGNLPLSGPSLTSLVAANINSCMVSSDRDTVSSSPSPLSPSPAFAVSHSSSPGLSSFLAEKGPGGTVGGARGDSECAASNERAVSNGVTLSARTKALCGAVGTEGENEDTRGWKKRKRHLVSESERPGVTGKEKAENDPVSFSSSAPLLKDTPECQAPYSCQKRGFPRHSEKAIPSPRKENRDSFLSVFGTAVRAVAVPAAAAGSTSSTLPHSEVDKPPVECDSKTYQRCNQTLPASRVLPASLPQSCRSASPTSTLQPGHPVAFAGSTAVDAQAAPLRPRPFSENLEEGFFQGVRAAGVEGISCEESRSEEERRLQLQEPPPGGDVQPDSSMLTWRDSGFPLVTAGLGTAELGPKQDTTPRLAEAGAKEPNNAQLMVTEETRRSCEKAGTVPGHETVPAKSRPRQGRLGDSGSRRAESARQGIRDLSQPDKARRGGQAESTPADVQPGHVSMARSRPAPRPEDPQPRESEASAIRSVPLHTSAEDTRGLSRHDGIVGEEGNANKLLTGEKDGTKSGTEECVQEDGKEGGAPGVLISMRTCSGRGREGTEAGESVKIPLRGSTREGERKKGRNTIRGVADAARRAASARLAEPGRSVRKLKKENRRQVGSLCLSSELSPPQAIVRRQRGRQRQTPPSSAAYQRAARSVPVLAGGGLSFSRKNASAGAAGGRRLSSSVRIEKQRRRSGAPRNAGAAAIRSRAPPSRSLHRAVFDCVRIAESGSGGCSRGQPSNLKKTTDACDLSPLRPRHQNFSLQRLPPHQLKGNAGSRQRTAAGLSSASTCCVSHGRKRESSLPRPPNKKRRYLPANEAGADSVNRTTCGGSDLKSAAKEVGSSASRRERRASEGEHRGHVPAETNSVPACSENSPALGRGEEDNSLVSGKSAVLDPGTNCQVTEWQDESSALVSATARKRPAGRSRVSTEEEKDVSRAQSKNGLDDPALFRQLSSEAATRVGREDTRGGDTEASGGRRGCRAVPRTRDGKSLQHLHGERRPSTGVEESNRRTFSRSVLFASNGSRGASPRAAATSGELCSRSAGGEQGLGTGDAVPDMLHCSDEKSAHCGKRGGSPPGNKSCQHSRKRGEATESNCERARSTDREHLDRITLAGDSRENRGDAGVKPSAEDRAAEDGGAERTKVCADSCSEVLRQRSFEWPGSLPYSRSRKRRSLPATEENKLERSGPEDGPEEVKARGTKAGKRAEGKLPVQRLAAAAEHSPRKVEEERGGAGLWVTEGLQTSRRASA